MEKNIIIIIALLFTWGASNIFAASCPQGTIAYSTGGGGTVCLPRGITCPPGASFNPNDVLCEAAPSCPDGLSLDQNTSQCTTGLRDSFGRFTRPSCPAGSTMQMEHGRFWRCTSPVQCPAGTSYGANGRRWICSGAANGVSA